MDPNLEAFIEMKLGEQGLSLASASIYVRDLECLLAFTASIGANLCRLEPEVLVSYITTLERRTLSPSTIARKLSSIRQFFFFVP